MQAGGPECRLEAGERFEVLGGNTLRYSPTDIA